MILLNLKKVKLNSEKTLNLGEIIQNYLNITNFGPLECPCCHSHDYSLWGHYERNVIFFSSDNKTLTSIVLSVQRVRCKGCGKTHALLPLGIIPYKQFSDEVITRIFNELFNNNINAISEKYSIDDSIIRKWIKDLKNIHLSRVIILIKQRNIKNSLLIFLNKIIYKEKYLLDNNRCFMQNKLGCINMSPI